MIMCIKKHYHASNLKYKKYLHQFFESFPGIDSADFLTKTPVQTLGDGIGEGPGKDHDELGDHDGVGTDGKAVARTDSLRRDLTEDDDG